MAAAVRKGIKISGFCLFGIYVAGLIYFLFLAEGYGRGMEGAVNGCNIYPFREITRYIRYRELFGWRIVFLNLAGNVLGFMPFGALLPILVRGLRKCWKAGLLSFEVSAVIEVSQLLFQVGCFDADDIILNTLGGVVGYAVFWCFSRIYVRMGGISTAHPQGGAGNYGKTTGIFL